MNFLLLVGLPLLLLPTSSFAIASPQKAELNCQVSLENAVVVFEKKAWGCRARSLTKGLPDSTTDACIGTLKAKTLPSLRKKCPDQLAHSVYGDPNIDTTLTRALFAAGERARSLFIARFFSLDLGVVSRSTPLRPQARAAVSRQTLAAGRSDIKASSTISGLHLRCRIRNLTLFALGRGRSCDGGKTAAQVNQTYEAYKDKVAKLGKSDLSSLIGRVLPFKIPNPTCLEKLNLENYYDLVFVNFPREWATFSNVIDGTLTLNDQAQWALAIAGSLHGVAFTEPLINGATPLLTRVYETFFDGNQPAQHAITWVNVIASCALSGPLVCSVSQGIATAYNAFTAFAVTWQTQRLNESMIAEKYLSLYYQYGGRIVLVAQSLGLPAGSSLADIVSQFHYDPFTWKRFWEAGDYDLERLRNTILARQEYVAYWTKALREGRCGMATSCGNGLIETPNEKCDLGNSVNGTSGSCCTIDCQLRAASEVCQPSAGECDLADTCAGSTDGTCPADAHVPPQTPCSDDSNPCTLDQCDGTSAVCQRTPGNTGATCRPSTAGCDPAETCTGSSSDCPTDVTNCSAGQVGWPMRDQNAQRTRRSPHAGPSTTPSLLWQLQWNLSGPVFEYLVTGQAGTLYTIVGVPHHGVSAIDPDSGARKWTKYYTDASFDDIVVGSNGTLYGASYSSLQAMRPEDGAVLWNNAAAAMGAHPPALMRDNDLFMAGGRPLRSIAGATGATRWTYTPTGNCALCDAYFVSGPVVTTEGVTIASVNRPPAGQGLEAVRSDGVMAWAKQSYAGVIQAVGPTGEMYGAWNGQLFAANANSTIRWSGGGSTAFGIAVSPDGVVYSGSDSGVVARRSSDGGVLWTFGNMGVLASNQKISLDVNGTLYVGGKNYVYAVNPDGTLKWAYYGPGFFVSPFVGGEGTVYVVFWPISGFPRLIALR